MSIPHFSLPFRFENHGQGPLAQVNEQDTFDEIFDCVQTIVRYPRGFRIDEPEFGTTEILFSEGDINAVRMQSEIREWEDRAEEAIEQDRDRFDEMILRIRIEVTESEDLSRA